jgi:hypothetical protein
MHDPLIVSSEPDKRGAVGELFQFLSGYSVVFRVGIADDYNRASRSGCHPHPPSLL